MVFPKKIFVILPTGVMVSKDIILYSSSTLFHPALNNEQRKSIKTIKKIEN